LLHQMAPRSQEARLVSGAEANGRCNVNRKNLSVKPFIFNLFHTLVELPYWLLFVLFIVYFMLINVVFASIYFVDVHGIDTADDWADCYYFAVQTFYAQGYGRLNPISEYINIWVSFHSFLALASNAMFVGILFAKITSPARNKLSVQFSSKAVINNKLPCCVPLSLDGKSLCYEIGKHPCLAIRCVPLRRGCLPSLTLLLIAKKDAFYQYQKSHRREEDPIVRGETETFGTNDDMIFCELAYEVNLQYGRTRKAGFSIPVLGIPLIVYHVIDGTSPLFGMTQQIMKDLNVEIVIMLHAIDESVSKDYQARASYCCQDILWNADFEPMVLFNPQTGQYDMDYNKLNSIKVLEENTLSLLSQSGPLNTKENPFEDCKDDFLRNPFSLHLASEKPETMAPSKSFPWPSMIEMKQFA